VFHSYSSLRRLSLSAHFRDSLALARTKKSGNSSDLTEKQAARKKKKKMNRFPEMGNFAHITRAGASPALAYLTYIKVFQS
jgi:hypothetical protein